MITRSTLKVILPAGEIPLGEQIMKLNDTTIYTLKDSVQINGLEKYNIVAKEGAVFLCGPGGNIESTGYAAELIWLVSPRKFVEFMSLN